MKFINKLIRDEEGATAIEYGLIAALIAVAAITAMQGLGNELSTTFSAQLERLPTGSLVKVARMGDKALKLLGDEVRVGGAGNAALVDQPGNLRGDPGDLLGVLPAELHLLLLRHVAGGERIVRAAEMQE